VTVYEDTRRASNRSGSILCVIAIVVGVLMFVAPSMSAPATRALASSKSPSASWVGLMELILFLLLVVVLVVILARVL
jgi:hypothetical protein